MSETTPQRSEGFFTNEDLFRLRTTAAETLKSIVTSDAKTLDDQHEGIKAQTMAALGIFQIEPQFDQQIEVLQKLEEQIDAKAVQLDAVAAELERSGTSSQGG